MKDIEGEGKEEGEGHGGGEGVLNLEDDVICYMKMKVQAGDVDTCSQKSKEYKASELLEVPY